MYLCIQYVSIYVYCICTVIKRGKFGRRKKRWENLVVKYIEREREIQRKREKEREREKGGKEKFLI